MRRALAPWCALALACGAGDRVGDAGDMRRSEAGASTQRRSAARTGGEVEKQGPTPAPGPAEVAAVVRATPAGGEVAKQGPRREPGSAEVAAVVRAASGEVAKQGPMRDLGPADAPAVVRAAGASDDRRAACLRRNAGAPARYARIVDVFCAEHHNLAGIGASLAIAEGGAPPFVATAGESCLGGQVVTAATRFRIGSLTKLLTAALVLRQVDAGGVDLDAEVVRVLPELGSGVDERAAAITWRQLLAHTAGVPDPPPLELGAEWLQALGERPLWGEPGALWSYSSDGYAIAGEALARLRGVEYSRLLVDELLLPLGLDAAVIEPDMAIRTGAACGHLGRGDAARAFSVVEDLAIGTGHARWTLPAGGAIASAAELVTLALDLVDPRRSPLSPAAVAELLRAEVPTHERPGERYGLGLRTRDGAIYGHGGNTFDFTADLVLVPGERFAVALLTNNGDPLRVTLAAAVQELLGVAPERAAAMGPASGYVGSYRADRSGAVVTISARGPALTLSAPTLALVDVALEHAGDHRFRAAGRPDLGGFTFVFAAGAARASDLRGAVFVGARVE